MKELLETRLQGSITKQMALDIISAIYSTDKSKFHELALELNNHITLNKTAEQLNYKQHDRDNHDYIKFREFEKLVLGNLLRTHRSFLCPFVRLFRNQDTKNLGYVNSDKFDGLLDTIDPFNNIDRETLYTTINFYDTEYFSFSEIVKIFATNNIDTGGQKVSILEYIQTSMS